MKQILPTHLFSATILSLVAAAMARPLAAQEIKLGIVDYEKTVRAYVGYADIEAQFERQRESWNQELDRRSRELKAMEEDFRAQQLMLSDEKKRDKLVELETQQRELERYYQQIFGPGGEAARKNEELLQPILDKVLAIVQELGEQEDFRAIFDSSSTGIIYAEPGVDLTQKVIDRLNASE
jgi:outer membrane protein